MNNEDSSIFIVISVPYEDGVDLSNPIVAVVKEREDAEKIVLAMAKRDSSLTEEDLENLYDIRIGGRKVSICDDSVLTTKEEINEVISYLVDEDEEGMGGVDEPIIPFEDDDSEFSYGCDNEFMGSN